jgi:hypothetical protein
VGREREREREREIDNVLSSTEAKYGLWDQKERRITYLDAV